MPTQIEPSDVNLFWVRDPGDLSLKPFKFPSAIACTSFAEALEMAAAPVLEGDARPWIQFDGTLFGPAQIDVLRRVMSRPAMP